MWTPNSVVADSEWWIVGAVAAAAVIFAFYNPDAAWMVMFFLIIMDFAAYLYGVSLWWVLGVPAGFITLGILYKCIRLLQKYNKSLLARRAKERRSLLPSNAPSIRPLAGASLRNASQLTPKYEPGVLTSPPRRQQGILPTHRTQERAPPLSYCTPFTRPLAGTPLRSDPHSTPRCEPRPLITSPPSRQPESVVHISAHSNRKVREHTTRPEIDGRTLHESVTEVVEDRDNYDQQIKEVTPLSATRSVHGVFKCYNCKPKKNKPEQRRQWDSSSICVEIWMSSEDHLSNPSTFSKVFALQNIR